MRLGIIGSRSITDEGWVWPMIDKFINEQGMFGQTPVLLSGGAKGVDAMVERYAKHWGYDMIVFEPYHKLDTRVNYTPLHYFIRNQQIVGNSDKILALWDGKSRGTDNTVHFARKHGVPVMVITK